jgi:hypothetical protein
MHLPPSSFQLTLSEAVKGERKSFKSITFFADSSIQRGLQSGFSFSLQQGCRLPQRHIAHSFFTKIGL